MKYFLSVLFLCTSLFLFAQQNNLLPYEGGEAQFSKDVSTLLIESGNPGRVYLIEISVNKKTQAISTFIHGAEDRDVTFTRVSRFFKSIENKWDKRFLQNTNVVIPLFISPSDPDQPEKITGTNNKTFAALIAETFKSKQCYLYKPVYVFKEGMHIDAER